MVLAPGRTPLAGLVAPVARLAAEPVLGAVRSVRGSPEDFGALVLRASLAAGEGTGRPVIVVDQFEELFTQCEEPAGRWSALRGGRGRTSSRGRPRCC